jgi:hypothetical protein
MSTMLLKMLLLPPDLLKSHAQGYADLVSEWGARYLCTLKNRWVLYGLSVLALVLGLIFGGVALLLWSALGLKDAPHVWVLLALPATCWLTACALWWWAGRLRLQPILKDLQTQIQLDAVAIGQAQSP